MNDITTRPDGDVDEVVRRLTKALKPFAEAARRLSHYGDIHDHYDGSEHHLYASRRGDVLLELLDGVDGEALTIADLVTARTALEGSSRG